MPLIHVSHFVLTSFSDALVTSLATKSIIKHRVITTGLEHQGQNSISDPDQNLGFTCIFSSGMQEDPDLTPQNTASFVYTLQKNEHVFIRFFKFPTGTPATQSQLAKDITTFLAWVAEPEHDKRKRLGIKMIFVMGTIMSILYYYKRHKWSYLKSRQISFKQGQKITRLS